MPKRKSIDDGEKENEQSIPLPIQTFLWRQTSPFIRPKLGKLHDSACVSFERVLVQNILHGLSPSLSDAITSISRWRFIQAALPHVMHCCASLLHQRKQMGNNEKLGSGETKLLYTMHWVIMDAAAECADNETGPGGENKFPNHYLFPLTVVQVFVYLFAPLIFSLKESDFQTFRLESGLKIWHPLWEYRQPDIPCFTTLVKPKRHLLKAQKRVRIGNVGDIYVGGAKHSAEDIFLGFDDRSDRAPGSPSAQGSAASGGSPLAPIVHMSDICALSTTETTTSAHVEILCEVCNTVVYSRSADGPNTCHCGKTSSMVLSDDKLLASQMSPVDKDFVQKKLDTALKSQLCQTPSISDVCCATYFDVAVLRCLFIPQWAEEGVFWALQYLYQRLQEIYDEKNRASHARQRSNSLPIPKIEVSLYQSPEQSRRDLNFDIMDSPFLRRASLDVIHEGGDHNRNKKFKASASTICFKHQTYFFDDKLHTKEKKKVTKEDSGGSSSAGTSDDQEVASIYGSSLEIKETKEEPAKKVNTQRPQSALAKLLESDIGSERSSFFNFTVDIVRRKSMPTLKHIDDMFVVDERKCDIKISRKGSFSSFLRPAELEVHKTPAKYTKSSPNPIITITEHTPVPSPTTGSPKFDSVKTDRSPDPSLQIPIGTIPRSHTDSNITYTIDDLQEVPGSTHFIYKNGHLNYEVCLKAVHASLLKERSLRICEVALNLLDILLDMGVVQPPPKIFEEIENDRKSEEVPKLEDKKGEELSPHNLAMNCLIRIFEFLGCPHGCGEGYRGPPGDFLRSQGQTLLNRLHRLDAKQFRCFLREMVTKRPLTEIADFFHAFVGFCVDPSATLSPISQKRTASQDGMPRGGYATNFGAGIGGAGSKGVEGLLVANVFKALVTRMVNSIQELRSPENVSLYCDVRQLMNYIKEAHGGMFRRVALSGLLDSADRPHKQEKLAKEKAKAAKLAKQNCSQDYEEWKEPPKSPAVCVPEEALPSRSGRRSIFKRKVRKAPSSTSIVDDVEEQSPSGRHRTLSPGMSLSGEESTSGPNTPKRKVSRFQLMNWLKSSKPDSTNEDELSDSVPIDSKSGSDGPLRRASMAIKMAHGNRMSFKAAGHMSLTFLRARKRMEDHLKQFGFGRGKSKRGSLEDNCDLSRRNSIDYDSGTGNEIVVIKERKVVDVNAIKAGMQRFNFLLEACQPGSIPDPQLIAAVLDLQAPVVARAALLFECAQFVHRCNKGNWPDWMKLNLPMFRPSGPLGNRGMPSGLRRTTILQRAAGRMFYQWAEAIGNKLEELIISENIHPATVVTSTTDETKRRQLRIEDDEEDFLDEATVNPTGMACPHALKLVACFLLLEITAFLRETYQYLPKTKTYRRDAHGWERHVSHRRWSSVLSSMGQSRASAHSIASLVEGPPGERKISFMVHDDNDSLHSSNTTLTYPEEVLAEEKKGRRLAQGRQRLLRRGHVGSTTTPGSAHNASFKRRSFKLRKQSEKKDDHDEGETGRRGLIPAELADGVKSRKVSAVSEKSDNSDHDHSGEESPGVLSDETQESPGETTEGEEMNYSRSMPWLRVVVQFANMSNFICDHQHFCHPNCYKRQMRSCARIMKAVRQIYGEESTYNKPDDKKDEPAHDKDDHFKRDKKEKISRKVSMQPSSPTRRRESTIIRNPEKDKTDSLTRNRSTSGGFKEAAAAPEPKVTTKEVKKESKEKENPMLKYLKTQVQNLSHSHFSLLIKAAVVMTEENFCDIMPAAWELMLESDQQLAASAAVMFILSSVKAPEQASSMMIKELQHEDPTQRINVILRFSILWRFRFQVWPRMEEGAHLIFKVPPPGIDFTLPSPTIGLSTINVVDPPWMPHFKTKVEEVTISHEETRSFVAATKTRRKQQRELVHKALQAEEEKKSVERENFLMTSVPIVRQAAYEPALHHAAEDHEEGEEERPAEHMQTHHIQLAQAVFPSCLCKPVLHIIHLLDDAEVNPDGVAVCEVAEKVIWSCLVEDSALFFRHFLEKLTTTKEKQEELIQLLRRLLRHIPKLPHQTAHTLFNYMLGYIMFYVRTPCEGSQESIGGALSVLWQIVPSVQGIYFKDLKQTLRKEQCDATLMVTANVPSAKKIIVHGPDQTSIPSQFPIHEDTQFQQILQDSLDFFNIPDARHHLYFLVDTKTNQMHNLNSYLRDFYFFRRSFYPQLSLIHMNPDQAHLALQKQAFTLKFLEIGKILLSISIMKSTPQNQLQQRMSFLHEELMKLPSFPRKALDAEFGLYNGEMGKELYGFDVIHKQTWTKLVMGMFSGLSGLFNWSGDIHLFLDVINGTLLLHCEDSSMLRLCLAAYINAARHFRNIFATNGYMLIMPTLLQIYSNHQTNGLLCEAVEFTCKQLFIMHRKPFILQMFGSIAAILDLDVNSKIGDSSKIQPKFLFTLLLSLDHKTLDPLDILELVEGEKPLKALDFCCEMEPDTFSVLDAISLCVTLVAYAPDSARSYQMLIILQAILPFFLKEIKKQTIKEDNPAAVRTELNTINSITVCMKALINSCEPLARNYSGPQRHFDVVSASGKTVKTQSNHSPQSFDALGDDFHTRLSGDNYRRLREHELEEEEMRSEFRKPRDSLLCVAAEFLTSCTPRVKELTLQLGDPSYKSQELLDSKCHMRLAEVAHVLLKLSPFDPITMRCQGLQRYATLILPITNWSLESVRPALNLILRRLDKTFNKIYKKPAIRRHTDWDAASNLLRGVYLTLSKYPYIAHLPHLKLLINVCRNLLLSDTAQQSVGDGIHNMHYSAAQAVLQMTPPPNFCSAVVRLITMQLQALGDQYPLEQVCGSGSTSSGDKVENLLFQLLLPLSIRVGCGRKDVPGISQIDIAFIVNTIINAINPPARTLMPMSNKLHLTVGDVGRSGSLSYSEKPQKVKESLYQTAFLGLKIVVVCFEKQLATGWHRITKCVQELGHRNAGGMALWSFLDFVVTHRNSLFVLLLPFIQYKMMTMIVDNEQEYYLQQLIKEKLQGYSLPTPKCKGSLLVDLATDLKRLKEDLANRAADGSSRTPTTIAPEPHSDQSNTSFNRRQRSSITEINSDQQSVTKLGPLPGSQNTPTKELITTMSLGGPLVESPKKSSLARDWSIQSESPTPRLRKTSIRIRSKEGSRRVVEKMPHQPPPVQEGEAEAVQELLQTSPSPRLQRKASVHIRRFLPGQSSVGSSKSEGGESQDTPTTSPTSETAPEVKPKHRLQRQKAQSRRTFRMSKKGLGIDLTVQDPLTSQPSVVEEEPQIVVQEQYHPMRSKSEEVPGFQPPRRRGAVLIRPRSPSMSPEPPPPPSSDAYIAPIAQCGSVESLCNNENSALLKDEEKTKSQSSICIYFDEKEVRDACV